MFLISIENFCVICSQKEESTFSSIKSSIISLKDSILNNEKTLDQEITEKALIRSRAKKRHYFAEELVDKVHDLGMHKILRQVGLVSLLEKYDKSKEKKLNKILIETSTGINTEIQFIIDQIKLCHFKIKQYDQFLLDHNYSFDNPIQIEAENIPQTKIFVVTSNYLLIPVSCVLRLKYYFKYLKPYVNFFYDKENDKFKDKKDLEEISFNHFNTTHHLNTSWTVFRYAYVKYLRAIAVAEDKMTNERSFEYQAKLLIYNPDLSFDSIEDEIHGFFFNEKKNESGKYKNSKYFNKEFLRILDRDIGNYIQETMDFINKHSSDRDATESIKFENYDIIDIQRFSVKNPSAQKNNIKMFMFLSVFASLSLCAALLKNKFMDTTIEPEKQSSQIKSRL